MKWSHAFLISLLSIGSLSAWAEEVGIPTGSQAPAFTLADQAAKEHSLQGLLTKGPLAIIFYRSADW